jgi:deoxyribodipyrimidine photo-lyase
MSNSKTTVLEIPAVPEVRIQIVNRWPVRTDGQYVLYWMTAFRRVRFNFALQRAVEWANRLQKPLVVFEAVRCNYRWASDRFHRFIMDGMLDNAAAIHPTKALYCSYVEPQSNHGHGLLESLASHASVTVSDDFPCFFHPALYSRVASRWQCALEIVDSNTIVPMRTFDRTFTVAHSYRRAMQKEVHRSLPEFPVESPLDSLNTPKLKSLPIDIVAKWQLWQGNVAGKELKRLSLDKLPIDHGVTTLKESGGPIEAARVLTRFVDQRLDDYSEARNEPEQEGSSWLSPYLHFGHISPHEVFQRVAGKTHWSHEKLSKPNGKMDGFWNMGSNAEAFMDQLMTWREIGFNMCSRERNFDRFESLPSWAQKTLSDHESDERTYVYELAAFERGLTHDPLWNAAQMQLVREGRMHNYLRMLWGKKILHWTATPRQALQVMVELNNKYALDGRDPNSYSGIFWVLGRYDRAWGPERPIFGKIRYMTSESTQNKYHVKAYIKKYAPLG